MLNTYEPVRAKPTPATSKAQRKADLREAASHISNVGLSRTIFKAPRKRYDVR